MDVDLTLSAINNDRNQYNNDDVRASVRDLNYFVQKENKNNTHHDLDSVRWLSLKFIIKLE